MPQHRWAEAIRAWANGEIIQSRRFGSLHWKDYEREKDSEWSPAFNSSSYEWRVKPSEKVVLKEIEFRLALCYGRYNLPEIILVDDLEGRYNMELKDYFIQWITPPQVIRFNEKDIYSMEVEGPFNV